MSKVIKCPFYDARKLFKWLEKDGESRDLGEQLPDIGLFWMSGQLNKVMS